MTKVLSRLKICSEKLFEGHKLFLEDCRKKAKDERACLGIVNDLYNRSEFKGEVGNYFKDYIPEVVFYWHFGGRKLIPTQKDINQFIEKEFKGYGDYKTFNDIPNKGDYIPYNLRNVFKYD